MKIDAKQVGSRIRERRLELQLSMPELAQCLGVNKSTIQRYEYVGVDPKRTMIISGLADALLTTPEWLLGLSENKEYSTCEECNINLSKHVQKYLECISNKVKDEPHQLLLTDFLGKIIDLYTVYCYYFAEARSQFDIAIQDSQLTESLMKYHLYHGQIEETIYTKTTRGPILDMIRFLEGISHIYDTGHSKVKIDELFDIVKRAEAEISESNNQ